MRRLAVFGASGHGKVVAEIAESCGWDEIVFFDDAWPSITTNGCWVVEGTGQALADNLRKFSGIFVAIGNNRIRAERIGWLLELSAPLVSLVHPSAVVSKYAELGAGSVVMPGVVVNVSACVGVGAILNTGCSVDHDCDIGSCVHISPGARLAGGVIVGNHSWVGIGACVKQRIRIGENVTVGAGAAVVSNLPDGVTAVGVPAMPS